MQRQKGDSPDHVVPSKAKRGRGVAPNRNLYGSSPLRKSNVCPARSDLSLDQHAQQDDAGRCRRGAVVAGVVQVETVGICVGKGRCHGPTVFASTGDRPASRAGRPAMRKQTLHRGRHEPALGPRRAAMQFDELMETPTGSPGRDERGRAVHLLESAPFPPDLVTLLLTDLLQIRPRSPRGAAAAPSLRVASGGTSHPALCSPRPTTSAASAGSESNR